MKPPLDRWLIISLLLIVSVLLIIAEGGRQQTVSNRSQIDKDLAATTQAAAAAESSRQATTQAMAILEATQKTQAEFIKGTLTFRGERVKALADDAANVQSLQTDFRRQEHEYLAAHEHTQSMLRSLGAVDPVTQPTTRPAI